MYHPGKQIRKQKFIHRDWNIILPIDHGFTYGPIDGLHPIDNVVNFFDSSYLNGIVAHRGTIQLLAKKYPIISSIGIIMQLNGMCCDSDEVDNKVMITSVKSAIQYGADAVSIQLNFTAKNFVNNIILLGEITQQANEYGLPVLVMLYDKMSTNDDDYVDKIRKFMRACFELSVDMVKISLPTKLDDIPRILDGFVEELSIFFAGGALCNLEDLTQSMLLSSKYGAKGFCIGRNIFQRNPSDEIFQKITKTSKEGLNQ